MAVLVAPMAEWKPFTGKTGKPLTHDIICAHTMVGKLIGSWDWANQSGNSYWHYGLGADGRLLQCVDLNLRSAANLEGNDRVIPIETEDGYPDGRTSNAGKVWEPWTGSNVPAWTDAQVDRLVELCVWLCLKFNIPPVMIPDTRQGRRGLAYHRQGIDPWRVDNGERWSNSDGKVCPGDRRVNQWVNVVVPRVAMGVSPPPKPPTPEENEDMLIVTHGGASLLVLGGEGTFGMTGTDRDAYRKAGIPEAVVSSDGWARFGRLPRLDVVSD